MTDEGVPCFGRYFTGLVINTSCSCRPISFMSERKSFPERPTNGLPVLASSFPGASPIKTILASAFPSPGTGKPVVPILHSLQARI